MATTDADADPEAVGRVVDVLDLQADAHGVDQEDLALAALAKIRKRGGDG